MTQYQALELIKVRADYVSMVKTEQKELQKNKSNMQQSKYILRILELAKDGFAQDAIEYAVTHGIVNLTYVFATDVVLVFGRYDIIMDAYRQHLESPEVLHAMTTFSLQQPQKTQPRMEEQYVS